MNGEKITYEDVREYENLFTLAPSFLIERFAKRNSNVVSKFESQIQSHLSNLDENQKNKLDLILKTDIAELQKIMGEAYLKSNIKQYRILSNPKYKEFIEKNLGEIRKLV
ncbi:hypothetical protein [Methanobrevibacter sp.]|uniref:hypothetical protein n=1 Tax=Methanobrevibacter sp. TaxID=66852 RepID=UPI0025F8C516|nr:hypothetical protein [Methanobrevibacter sp.]MBQ2665305.1 hypothetical protein [Methanobrevibacter sp.]